MKANNPTLYCWLYVLVPTSEFLDTMRIVCVPVLDDNFSYLLIDEMGVTAAVDPAEPEKASCPQYISYVSHNTKNCML